MKIRLNPMMFVTANTTVAQVTFAPRWAFVPHFWQEGPFFKPGANQTFVISLTPTAALDPTDVRFGFNCTDTDLAPTVIGLNTLLLTASETPVPDIVALAATSSQEGIVTVPGMPGAAAFSVATVNVGAAGAITATADTGTASLPMSLSLCRTNPRDGSVPVRHQPERDGADRRRRHTDLRSVRERTNPTRPCEHPRLRAVQGPGGNHARGHERGGADAVGPFKPR